MLLVADVRPEHRVAMTADQQQLFGIDKLNVARSSIPAVTHVDYSARVQTVHRETNPRYHALISKFHDLTGCPVIVNTSFNVRGEPLVCTPEDSFRCFMGTEIDVLAIGNFYLEKDRQPEHLKQRYEDRFDLDWGESTPFVLRPPPCTGTRRHHRHFLQPRADFDHCIDHGE